MSKSTILRRVAALVLVGGALTIAVVATAKAPVPSTIGHQGRLYENVDLNGDGTLDTVPVSGDRLMQFDIFKDVQVDPSTGGVTPVGDPVWTEKQTVKFTDGYYAVALGSGDGSSIPTDLLRLPLEGEGLYLQITIGTPEGTLDAPLRPLARLGSVPYALVCDDATGDIHPTSVTARGPVTIEGDLYMPGANLPGPLISADGKWLGDTAGLGEKGDKGDQGDPGVVNNDTRWGGGANPTMSWAFISPTVPVTVNGTQDVIVTGQKTLGSTVAGGGTGLSLNICYQDSSGAIVAGDPLNPNGISGLRVSAGTRMLQSMTIRIQALPAGDYNVGLCAMSTNPGSWNDNGPGVATAMVVNSP